VEARSWPTLAELFHAMKRRMVLATFLAILVGLAAGAAVWLAMPSGKHQVRSLVEMKPYVPVLGKAGNDNDFDAYKQNQMVLIKSRPLLTRVVGNPKVSRLAVISTSDDPIRYLEEQIRLKWEAPQMLAVTINGDDPQALTVILEALLAAYLEETASDEIKARGEKRKKLEFMLKEVDRQIDFARQEMKRAMQLGAGPTKEMNTIQYQLYKSSYEAKFKEVDTLNSQIKDLEANRNLAEKSLQAVDNQSIDREELERLVASTDVLKEKFAERAQRTNALKKLKEQVLPGNPLLLEAERSLTQIDDEIKGLVEQQRPALQTKWRLDKKTEYKEKIEKSKADLAEKNRKLVELNRELSDLKEKLDNLQKGQMAIVENDDIPGLLVRHDLIKHELDQLSLADKSDSRITVREAPHVLLSQNLKQKVLLALAAATCAGLLIILAVAFLEWRSRRVDSVEQIVNELGIRVIGTIPAFPSKASLKSGDPVTSQNWRFILNESVNSTRTMLLHTAKAQSMQVIMVSSAMQGEGKTSLASQLGTSMATAGLRTLILDCDLRNPSMHKLFDAPLTPGCSEILCQEVDVSDAVQPTSVPNLWLIPAGQCSNRVITSLAQGHPLETLFNRLRGQFDFIVVDSCPVLPVADSLLVGQHVDGVVISILQDISQLPKVQTASEKLTHLNIPLLGAVVSGIKPDVHAYGYNYVKQLPA